MKQNGHKPKPVNGNKQHALTVKEQCVKAVLEQGRTSLDVSSEYGVPSRSIRRWVQETGQSLAKIGQEKMEECAELALEYLSKNLQTLNSQAVMLGDVKWLCAKNTDPERINAIAVSHGILADKSFRLLEAAQRASERAVTSTAGQLTHASGD